jgi:hypothetical protein
VEIRAQLLPMSRLLAHRGEKQRSAHLTKLTARFTFFVSLQWRLTAWLFLVHSNEMQYYSTREAAKSLGIPHTTLATYLAVGKIPHPQAEIKGKTTTQIWTEAEIEHVRELLPKIANGRKTRYKKQSPKAKKKTQARVPAPQKKK